MRYGVVLPGGTASRQLAQAEAAERAGWDAVFVWETGYGVDPWSLLSAMAVRTQQVRLGTLLTPAPWRRPWKLASQIATLDQLSSGRAIVTLGLGAVSDDLPSTGETTDLRERAARLDETIDLLRTLWAGGREHHGTYFDVVCPGWLVEAAAPVQQAIPIWVAGAWSRPRSMQRALRCDGVVAEWHLGRANDLHGGTPEDLRDLCRWLSEHGSNVEMDVICQGETPTEDPAAAAAHVASWGTAGCTWWMETRWGSAESAGDRLGAMDARMAAGPPTA